MKVPVVLAVLIGTLVLACSTAAPAPAESTPNIDATVEARVAQERAVDATVEARVAQERADATVEARVKEEQAAQPTPKPIPTPTPTPTSDPTDVGQPRLIEGDIFTLPDISVWGHPDVPSVWEEFEPPPWNINITGRNFPCYVGLSSEEQDASNIIEVTVGDIDIKPSPISSEPYMWNSCKDMGPRPWFKPMSQFDISFEIPALDFGEHEITVSAGNKVAKTVFVNRAAPPIPENFKIYDLKDAIVLGNTAPSVDHVTLGISPIRSIAGRELEIRLRGLSNSPRTNACISLVDPDGDNSEMASVFADIGPSYLQGKSMPKSLKDQLFGAIISPDDSRIGSWLYSGFGDRPGTWSVYIDLYDDSSMIYAAMSGAATPGYRGSVLLQFEVEDLGLGGTESVHIGLPLTKYHREESSVFFSDDVASAVAFDSIRRLELAAVQIEEILGVVIGSIPDMYLVGDIRSGDQLNQAVSGENWTPEDSLFKHAGFYRSAGSYTGSYSGIYVLVPVARSNLNRIIVHEYIHHVNKELRRSNPELPHWLNEGTAEYYQYELNDSGEDELEGKRALLKSLERAHLAALSGDLPSLESIDDEWVAIPLNYSVSDMVVRFMIETFGSSSPFDTVREFEKANSTIEEALLSTTGLTYQQFETGFREWIGDWSGKALESDIHRLERGIEKTRYCDPVKKVLYKKQ